MSHSLLSAIELIVKKAPDLRAAGVSSLSCDGVTVTLLPATATADDGWVEVKPEPEPRDPLSDPDTYAGGVVPTIDQTDD